MTICIGSMGKGRFAELDIDHEDAEIFERGTKGEHIGPLATVPIDLLDPVDDDHDPTLDPDSRDNKNLMMFLVADRMLATLQLLAGRLRERDAAGSLPDAEFQAYLARDPRQRWREDSEMFREVEEVCNNANRPSGCLAEDGD